MKIYTKKGDHGETGLFGGDRVSKGSERVEAYGTVDEANSCIGLAAATPGLDRKIRKELISIMSDLLDLGSELSTPIENQNASHELSHRLDSRIGVERVDQLEKVIDELETQLSPLQTFILPTGSEASARLHLARTACRRAEREIERLSQTGNIVRPILQQYINRLGDVLFVMARFCNHKNGYGDIKWQPKK